jgi:hypothetical protein
METWYKNKKRGGNRKKKRGGGVIVKNKGGEYRDCCCAIISMHEDLYKAIMVFTMLYTIHHRKYTIFLN